MSNAFIRVAPAGAGHVRPGWTRDSGVTLKLRGMGNRLSHVKRDTWSDESMIMHCLRSRSQASAFSCSITCRGFPLRPIVARGVSLFYRNLLFYVQEPERHSNAVWRPSSVSMVRDVRDASMRLALPEHEPAKLVLVLNTPKEFPLALAGVFKHAHP